MTSANHTKIQLRRTRRATCCVLALIGLSAGGIAVGQSQTAQPPAQPPAQPATRQQASEPRTAASADEQIRLPVNKSRVLNTDLPYQRVSIAQPEIADVNPIGPRTILITAKKAGSTQIIVWDDQDRSQILDVQVEVDLDGLKAQLA